jgi:two-component system nitrate/nitrite response regulator NarL
MSDRDGIRIVVADDHTLLREALCDALLVEDDFVISGVAGDGEEVLAVSTRTKPDVVLLDLDMPRHNPVQTVRRLRGLVPAPKVVILTMHDRADSLRTLLDAGVAGYLSKNVSRQHLVTTIRSVRAGQAVTITVSGGDRAGPSIVLSARELEVLALVAEALSNRQIASRLSITVATVKRHLRNVFEKLGATSRMAAVMKAREAELLPPDSPYL